MINVRQKARKDAEVLRTFLVGQIERGIWMAGDRLPTERELVDKFGMARNTVRKTLEDLERQGRIYRHVGRGTFVAEEAIEAGAALLNGKGTDLDASPADVIECRLLFEPAMVELAVTRATQADVDRKENQVRQGDQAKDWRLFEYWDEALHRSIADATRNPVVIQVHESLAQVRRQGEWGQLKEHSLTPERRIALQREHREIVLAIRERDIRRAQIWTRRHLVHVRSYMFNLDEAEQPGLQL